MTTSRRTLVLASSITVAVALGGCDLLGGDPPPPDPPPVIEDAPGDDTLGGAVAVPTLPSQLRGTLSPTDGTDTFAVSPSSGTFALECSSTGETTFRVLDSGGNLLASGYCYPVSGGSQIPLTVAVPAYVQLQGANDSSYTVDVSML